MADADPLGVDMNVTFDNVGGLDDRECPPFCRLRSRGGARKEWQETFDPDSALLVEPRR